MISTLLVTILTEGAVVISYSVWRKKPAAALLITSIGGNLLTQSMLWIVLSISFHRYLLTLAVAEVLIWGIEALLFVCIRANHLRLSEAAFLSLVLNLTSLAAGWFLPV